ncbi:MAG: hypothetical protein JW833_16505 [Prolixibacteraceae bacterium]|nr:hypothetical protein [Prolixibacteraceae bacterium]
MKILIKLLNLFIFFFPGFLFAQGGNKYITVHLKNETYQKGNLLTAETDYFFDSETGILVVSGTLPENHIKISNRFGEIKIYYPEDNKVAIKQNRFYSSENELIYYFFTNNYYDLGLSDEGFTVSDTRMDGNYQVTTWTAPISLNLISKVELVFENGLPVYAAYFNMNGNIIRKIYYYNYEIFSSFTMPMKVTQISYISENDSVVQRNTWSLMKELNTPGSGYFNFKIPEDAIVVQ